MHRIIYEELCRGIVRGSSLSTYVRVMEDMVREGARAVVLGCTEIGLLVDEGDTEIPLYDTARIHAEAAVEWMLEEKEVSVV